MKTTMAISDEAFSRTQTEGRIQVLVRSGMGSVAHAIGFSQNTDVVRPLRKILRGGRVDRALEVGRRAVWHRLSGPSSGRVH